MGRLHIRNTRGFIAIYAVDMVCTEMLSRMVPAADPALLARGMDSLVSIMLAESIEQSSRSARRKAETAADAARFVAKFSAGGLLYSIGHIRPLKGFPPKVVHAAG